LFDRFRIRVGNAALALNAFKNINPVVDSFDKVGNKVLKVVVPAMTEAEKAAAALAAQVAGVGGAGGGGVAKAVKTAVEKLKLYTDALKGSNSAQKSFTQAQKASVQAGKSLTAANQGVADAQAAFNQAVAGYGADSPQAKKAALELAQAQRGLERAGYNVEGSLFAIANAEDALKKVRADPESTPQAIREAEIALAEAKLSSADAIDQQAEATNNLSTATDLLNEAIFGAAVGSDLYTKLSDALTEAKERQAEAVDAVAEALEREAEALENYNDAFAKLIELMKLYPLVLGGMPNPVGVVAGTIPVTVTGGTGTKRPEQGGGGVNIVVQAGLVASADQIAQELADLSARYAKLNGGNGFFGSGV